MGRNLKIHIVNNNSNNVECLFDDNGKSTVLLKAELVTELNQAGMLTVTLPATHPQYDFEYKIIGTTTSILINGAYGTDVPFWRGRLYSVDVNLQGDKTLVFEGILARLSTLNVDQNAIASPSAAIYTLLQRLLRIYQYGKYVQNGTANAGTEIFTRGTVPDEAKSTTNPQNLADLTEEDTVLAGMQYLISKLNTSTNKYYLKLSGVNLTEVGIEKVNTASKDLITADMITSYSANLNGEPFANRVYAYGATGDDDVRLNLSTVTAGNVPYVEIRTDAFGVDDVGVVGKTVIYDSVKKASKLLSYANRELTKAFKVSRSYKVDMIDTYALNGDYSHFYAGKAVRFSGVGALSGFDTYITARIYDLLNPLNDSIVIEQNRKKLTSII